MKRFLSSLFLIAVLLPAFISCEKEYIIVDSDSSLVWHVDDVEYLDSIVEYDNNRLFTRNVWTYDEYGRLIEEIGYSFLWGNNFRRELFYSEGGKRITVVELVNDKGLWVERSKSERVIVARNDTCTDYYKMESGRWVLIEQMEVVYDDAGRPVTYISYHPDNGTSLKSEFKYDSKGHCIQEHLFTRRNDDWILSHEVDRSFDERGNCVYVKSQRTDVNTGSISGDSIMEQSFDEKNRRTSYSLKKWDFSNASWAGKQKYSIAFDERGNVIENVNYVWDATKKDWLPKDKTSKSYDEEGRLISDANYTWRDSVWVGLGFKYEKRFDSNGNLIFDASFVWSDRVNDWAVGHYIANEFDSDGNITHYTTLNGSVVQEYSFEDGYKIRENKTYNSFTGEVSSEIRWFEYYDENGNDTLIVEYHWFREQWEVFEITKYTYDGNGSQNSSSIYRLQNGEWVMINGYKYEAVREGNTQTRQKYVWDLYYQRWEETSTKEVLTYDEAGRIKMFETKTKVWDDAVNTHWEDNKRIEYSYDSNGNKTGFVVSYWHSSENRWIYGEKQEYAFDAAGYKILEAHYMFDNTNQIWLGESKWTAEFDDNGNQTLLMSYKWGYQDGWGPSAKTITIYDDKGNILDRAKYEMTFMDGFWDWQGTMRTIYMFDPETKTHKEYNLTFNFITQSWEGNRMERETDVQGNVICEIVYKWKDEQWFRNTVTTYDSRGNEASYSSYRSTQDGESFIEISYSYDSKNRLVETVRSLNGVVAYTKNVYYSVHKDIKVIDDLTF